MKSLLSFKIVFLVAFTIILTSCGNTNNVVSNRLIQKRKYNKGWHFNSTIKSSKQQKNREEQIAYSPLIKIKKSQSLSENQLFNSKCDRINTNNGLLLIEGKVIEVSETEIKYKKCNDLDGPTYSILKSEVSIINYANGEFDDFKEENRVNAEKEEVKLEEEEEEEEVKLEEEVEDHYLHNNERESFSTKNKNLKRKIEPLGFLAFILTIASIIAPFLFIPAIILAIISLTKIRRNPTEFKGRGFPLFVIILTVIAALLTGLILVAIML